jgi:hypothetical protein
MEFGYCGWRWFGMGGCGETGWSRTGVKWYQMGFLCDPGSLISSCCVSSVMEEGQVFLEYYQARQFRFRLAYHQSLWLSLVTNTFSLLVLLN